MNELLLSTSEQIFVLCLISGEVWNWAHYGCSRSEDAVCACYAGP